MRIRTQFIMTMLLYGVVLLAISASAINTNVRVDRATEQEKIAESIAQGASELSYLANDYVIYRESQQLVRWQSRFASFASDVAKLQTDTPEQRALDRNLQANTQRLKEVFYSVVTAVGRQSPDQGGTIDPVLLQVSWSRLSVQSQGMVSDATRLSQLLRAQTDRLMRANSIIIFSMISIFVAYFVGNYLVTQRRVLRGVANLQAGTAVIGSGNLDFKIEEKKNDEIGDLSHAFNRMTTNLREITASKAELEKEVAARKEAEEELLTTNDELQEKTVELEAEIEERKKAEAEVTHLATFPELNPSPVIELDIAGKLNYLNPAARALFPDFPTTGAGHPFLADWESLTTELRRGGEQLLTRDIKIGAAWYEQNITYVPSLQQFRIYATDITERKQAEETIKLEETRLTSLLEISQHKVENVREFLDFSLDEAIKLSGSKIGYLYLYDEQKRELTLNTWSKDVMEECTVATPETVYQLDKTGIWGEVVRQRKPIIINDFQAPNPLKRGYPAGHARLSRWMSIPVFSDEKIVAILGIANKATDYDQADVRQLMLLMSSVWKYVERKKMEALAQLERDRLLSILNSMEDAVCIMDREHGLEYINPSMQAQFGKIEGRKCHQYFHGADDVCGWCNNEEVFGGKILRRETHFALSDKTFEVTYSPLKNADGSVSKLAVLHDITERKKADRMKDEFIGMVSHEIKTPITIIMGSIYTALSQGIPREEADELLKEAASSSESLASIVDNLLELSRAQANRLMISKETLDVAEIARSIVAKFKGWSEIHHLVVRVPEVLPAALADRVRVGRVLNNLIENAIKYSPQGGEVTVFAREKDDYLVVGVTDRGVGISSEDQARLFKPFERLENVSGIGGVGLGLQVCRVLVEAHGGRIWVESKPGKGSTFFFTIPLNG